MRFIRRIGALFSVLAVVGILSFAIHIDHKWHGASVSLLSSVSIGFDLVGPPTDPAIAAVLHAAPRSDLNPSVAIVASAGKLGRYNADIAGKLHMAGLATHSQPRAQFKV